jgi:hypothetical protein
MGMNDEIEALTMRLSRLERANRQLKLASVAVLLLIIALGGMAFGGKSRIVEADKIVVHDSHGRARITIGTPEVAGGAIDLKADEPAIWLTGENGSDRTILTGDGLYLGNGHARRLVDLTSGPTRPELRFYDRDGKVSWPAP